MKRGDSFNTSQADHFAAAKGLIEISGTPAVVSTIGLLTCTFKWLLNHWYMEVAVSTLNLDSLPTRPVCTLGSQINKFFCFNSTVVLTITPRVTPIAPARQHIHSTCTGGKESIVSYPPADATTCSHTHTQTYTQKGVAKSTPTWWPNGQLGSLGTNIL